MSSESNGLVGKKTQSSPLIYDEQASTPPTVPPPPSSKSENKSILKLADTQFESPNTGSNGNNSNNNNNQEATEISFGGSALTTPLLSITPGDELVFDITRAKSDILQNIKLTNTSGMPLAYKVI